MEHNAHRLALHSPAGIIVPESFRLYVDMAQ